MENLYSNIPDFIQDELIQEIASTKNCRIERIISDGHTTEKDFWYDQNENEFVLLVKGSAVISFENNENINMNPGDYIIIPANKKHRVTYTSNKEKTLWLAVFYN